MTITACFAVDRHLPLKPFPNKCQIFQNLSVKILKQIVAIACRKLTSAQKTTRCSVKLFCNLHWQKSGRYIDFNKASVGRHRGCACILGANDTIKMTNVK